MMEFTKSELAWVKRVQKVLDACPSKRIAFATSGDRDLALFDVGQYEEIFERVENTSAEFISAAVAIGAIFPLRLIFPNQVESTAG
ncbi:TPA: hypothetical protein QIT63_002698 [Escherichia coli]|nr:hypothetical protein [Escherichia coli]HEP1391408.1 hypothetical protein [Escherichia coli]